jgi:hypothetical protein
MKRLDSNRLKNKSSVAEPHLFDAVPGPDKHFDAAPAPTLLQPVNFFFYREQKLTLGGSAFMALLAM